ncbi:bifunctional diguanylate cyclase/phosphodiesterase [Glaciecola sp. 1036]|uniref:bifunctional diguanylate cyclase/phosphodiesterase n=1 Tax=Alteromonadaceae TaxID=72275 RepID=UPI003D069E2D
MSLSKQLGIGFFLILLLIFVGTLWLNIQNTREYIEQQLESHAQDTATSLGLSITPYIGNDDDLAIVETMQQAIFDRGYYQKIVLTDTDGKVLVTMSNPVTSEQFPDWFTSLFPLNAPEAETQINDGWNIKGNLLVVSNVGLGYQQLYANAQGSFVIFILAFLLTGLFVWLLISKVVSKPLAAVLKQADEISHQEFNTINLQPKTPEFSRIIQALNRMSNKLATMFAQITRQSEEYRRFAYVDMTTGAGNRRSFELAIMKLLSDANNHAQGHLFFIKATSLGSIHKSLGGLAGDQYLASLVSLIKEVSASKVQHFSIYRMNGADIALIIEDIDENTSTEIASAIIQATKRIEKSEHTLGVAHVGVTKFSTGQELADLLEQADSALTSALENENRWFLAQDNAVNYSNEVWREKIKELLARGSAEFVQQPIKRCADDGIEYQEWFARLPNKVNSMGVPMNQLMPASIKLDFATQIDKLIVINLLEVARTSEVAIGLNLSRFSLLDAGFSRWFLHTLNSHSAICPKIVLEIPERALVQDIQFIKNLVKELKSLGIKIAVEHFGAQLAGISHLRNIMPDYLKIDGRFIRNIDQHLDNQLFVNSLIGIAKGLSINVIAEMVETEGELEWLKNAGVDLVQGYFIGTPQ